MVTIYGGMLEFLDHQEVDRGRSQHLCRLKHLLQLSQLISNLNSNGEYSRGGVYCAILLTLSVI